jgi:DNA-binding transcriptional ArsR family regulator
VASAAEWRRAVLSAELPAAARALAVWVADSTTTEGFRFDADMAAAALSLSVATVRSHWRALLDAGWLCLAGRDDEGSIFTCAEPWTGSENGALVLVSPAAAVRKAGKIEQRANSAAQILVQEWFAWSRAQGVPPVQNPITVQRLVSQALMNGVDRNDLAKALGEITRANGTLTEQSLLRALATVRGVQETLPQKDREAAGWYERARARAAERDAARREA